MPYLHCNNKTFRIGLNILNLCFTITDFSFLQIWSCEHCYSFFHLNCIQRWANDSTAQKRLYQEQEVGYYNNQGEYIAKEKKIIKWNCPNCRHDYGIN